MAPSRGGTQSWWYIALRFIGAAFLVGECWGGQGNVFLEQVCREVNRVHIVRVRKRRSQQQRREDSRALSTAKRLWKPEWLVRTQQVDQRETSWDPLWSPRPEVSRGWRRPTRSFRRRPCRPDRSGRSRRTSAKWGRRGERIGEASHPGPGQPGSDTGPPQGGRRQRPQRSRSRTAGGVDWRLQRLSLSDEAGCYPDSQGR